jgi:hypothetical protein
MSVVTGRDPCLRISFAGEVLFSGIRGLIFGISHPLVSDSLSFCRSRETRIRHYLVNGISRLSDDKLQVQVGHPRNHDSLGSGAVLIHRISARADGRQLEFPVDDKQNSRSNDN